MLYSWVLFRKQLQQRLYMQLKKNNSNRLKKSTRITKQEVTTTRSEVSIFDLHEDESGEIGSDHAFTLWEESADM